MPASHAPAIDAMAFQLAAALERYGQDAGRMADTWLDMELYRSVSDQVEQIRMYSSALPQLSVQWVELLIAHAELVHSLWRARFREGEGDAALLFEVRERHAACVEGLRQRCLRFLSREDRSPGPRQSA
ncbi:hypothetical protein HHL11_15725 [Ramlibacter sp. G-1-2-2]|uniref:Uncharacterized protein n=1 Tax=Ramlibacter agri TaxID=2728837 RepID=A0A848H9N4_9BURK|nr:hypothetical protein [Ramlibacter agri]NML45203.1 hypothetical protein [Ramlibacter agri]